MKKITLLIILTLITILSKAEWIQTNGPYTGKFTCMAVSGTTLFAGLNSSSTASMYKSDNGGTSWTSLTGYTGGLPSVILVDGSSIFTASASGTGVSLSTDNGTTWMSRNNGLSSLLVYCLLKVGSNMYAGTSGGVFITADAGANWSTFNNGWTPSIPYITSMTYDGTKIFATNGSTVYTYNGTSWVQTSNGLLVGTSILNLTSISSKVYLGSSKGVYLTSNSGALWSAVNTGLPDTTNYLCFASMGSSVFAGSDSGAFMTTNNGASWPAVNTGLSPLEVHMLFVNGSDIFAGSTYAGLYKSTNSGTSWVKCGLPLAVTSSLTVSGSDIFATVSYPSTFEGGGVYKSSNNGTSWEAVNKGITNCQVYVIAATGSSIFMGAAWDGLFRSTDSGNNWTHLTNGISSPINISSIAFDVTAIYMAGTLTGGVNPGMIYKSTDNGAYWSNVNNGVVVGSVNDIVVDHSNVYVTTNNGLYKSSDAGSNWTKISNNTSFFPNGVWNVAVRDSVIFASTGTSLYRSTNEGVDWEYAGNGLHFGGYATILFSGNFVFLGDADGGLHVTEDNGRHWTSVSNGLPTASNSEVRKIILKDGILFAATNYNSVWSRPLSEIHSSIENNFSMKEQRIFPNPTQGKFLIQNLNAHTKIEVFNSLGEIIYNSSTISSGDVSVDLTGFANGIYFAKFSDEKSTRVRKIVVE